MHKGMSALPPITIAFALKADIPAVENGVR
jgi:hypothetical protein